ncbi:MAG TPA: hypothetical protein VIH59_31860 [Candidatus Tectomicrobia bacterium]|jgi:hypothetical protein
MSLVQQHWWCFLFCLWVGTLDLLGCAPLLTQPRETQPYALLVFPEAMRLVALDTQTINSQMRTGAIRVTPGRHRLRMVYIGPSQQHAEQQNTPFCLETQQGQQYFFDPVTRGVIWRPEVVMQTRIPGYCTTHQCSEEETPLPLHRHGTPCPEPAPQGRRLLPITADTIALQRKTGIAR